MMQNLIDLLGDVLAALLVRVIEWIGARLPAPEASSS